MYIVSGNFEKEKHSTKDNLKQKQSSLCSECSVRQKTSSTILCILILVATILILLIVANQCQICLKKMHKTRSKTYWIVYKRVDLSTVLETLQDLGYTSADNTTNWDLFWSHFYPFYDLMPHLQDLQPHQKVNHIPLIGLLVNDVDLASNKFKYIRPSFELPTESKQLLLFSKNNPQALFMQRSNYDKRINNLVSIENVNFDLKNTFIQHYVDNPLLINGRKFEIGVFVVITSVDPLRIYIYKGDAFLRFCATKYFPFNATRISKYLLSPYHLPLWNIPGIEMYYNELGFNMKDSMNAFLRAEGRNPDVIWRKIKDCIRLLILSKESRMIKEIKSLNFTSTSNFFELLRFNFVVDENLDVFLMEVNMSPNLSSANAPKTKTFYQELIYSTFSLLGFTENLRFYESESIHKQIGVFPKRCASKECQTSCKSTICQLCKHCLTEENVQVLHEAYVEHLNSRNFKRLFPLKMTQQQAKNVQDIPLLSPANQLQLTWFKGKCLLDPSWC